MDWRNGYINIICLLFSLYVIKMAMFDCNVVVVLQAMFQWVVFKWHLSGGRTARALSAAAANPAPHARHAAAATLLTTLGTSSYSPIYHGENNLILIKYFHNDTSNGSVSRLTFENRHIYYNGFTSLLRKFLICIIARDIALHTEIFLSDLRLHEFDH